MDELQSFLGGRWVRGSGPVQTLVNPATEQPLATTCTAGLDFAEAMRSARAAGATLRAMTFVERGQAIRALSRALHGAREQLIALAVENGGNTRSDAKFDVDGAIGTLAAYADLAVELGERRFLVDGDGVQLGKGARLYGQHLWVPREGVAVHVNAFNFPAWGFAEKAAVALLAGMPVVVKPATSTALVAARMMELFVEAAALPPNAISLIAGAPGDLLGHLTGQDVLAFTGGSATGVALRAGKAALAHSVRVNVEADSLNAAVLAPDVEQGSDVLNLFLGDVVRDLTQKAGQKCTAIRRVYVPREQVDHVLGLLGERLAAIKVGDPARDDVTMGPLATGEQRADVKAGIARLASCARVAFGGGSVEPLGVPGDKGFFVGPTLYFSPEPRAGDAVHEHEVFGPVATVMPYDGGAAMAAALVRAGGGGLVSSVYGDDKQFLKDFVLGIAPYHGRVTIGSSKIAAQALPPGMVLPGLVHGGPGRAGGGEELGGRRGLAFYSQRVALQGDRALLEAIAAS
ncbi:MAG: 3,4-dehydroadipyl-CoA semialdehyde dehydrogenase [Deltaproteobacteria bacterium]|nr:3,4-dehydroadipyl-CoA semialdehyde dehydrogenase [Deltaproteobacteria bacterium]